MGSTPAPRPRLPRPEVDFQRKGGISTTSTPAITFTTLEPIVTAVTDVITQSAIVSILAGTITACIGFVLFWWAVRKVVRAIKAASLKGKLKV